MGHDQLFKLLLQAFFADFVGLFAPDAAAALDWSTLTFRDAEMFTDLPQGERRAADLVAQAYTLGGLRRLILLHVEVQRRRQAHFPLRMWQYYAALRLREDLPVLPIALLLYPAEQGLSLATYEEEVLGQTYLTFRYLQISAPLLSAEEYVGAATPLGAGLAAVMRPATRGRAGRIALHRACLRRIREAVETGQVDEARAFLLVNMVATYLSLSPAEEQRLRAQMSKEGDTTMEATELTWADRILLRGREEGQRAGREEGQRATIREAALARFGSVPPGLEQRLTTATDDQELRALIRLVSTAATPADLT